MCVDIDTFLMQHYALSFPPC